MSIRSGYSAIEGDENDPVAQANRQENSQSLLERIRQFGYKKYARNHYVHITAAVLIALFIILMTTLALWLPEDRDQDRLYRPVEAPVAPGISSEALRQGLAKCQGLQKRAPTASSSKNRTVNPRAPQDVRPVLIKNAVVWDGQGRVLDNVDILMTNGVIAQVKQHIQAPASAKVIDAKGHIVSPGLVDMHTHLGVMSWPNLKGTSDANEVVEPATPFVKVLDAFNPSDKAIRIVASGGITTALVLPGSSNLIGGEAYAFKLRPVSTMSNQDMLVQSGIDETEERRWRYMKMACGENPKGNYGRRGRIPSTRMGEAYVFRQSFANAQALVEAQNDWCSAAVNLDTDNQGVRLSSRFPEDQRLEALTALLRGDVKLNIHCYETHDIEAMVRHANEFNFDISAFHHALEAYKIPDILRRARNNITIATFADHWGYKKEAFGASPYAPKLMHELGIPVALKSDHPVLNSQHMAFEAAKATHYGLPSQEAFKAITSVPAQALGLGHRVGSLKEGYDADVVIWDRSPLALGAAPLQVFVDGIPLFDEKPIEPVKRKAEESFQQQPKSEFTVPSKGARDFVLTNIGFNFLSQEVQAKNSEKSSLVVMDGEIVCFDDQESCNSFMVQKDLEIIDAQGGYVLPGLIAVGSKLGLVEIPSESSTGDGIALSSSSQNPKAILEAVDGLKLGTTKLKEAYKGGVLTTISAPISNNVVIGVSAAFKTNADSVLSEGTLLSPAAALHVQIGHALKSSSFPTVSAQISFLRQIFSDNIYADNRYGQAARGDIPLIVMVNNKDEIASIIKLKEQTIPKARLAIMGGAEAHLLAPHLANANIAVILRPSLCTPESFDSIHCLTGAPLTNGTAAHVLHLHGVKVGLGVNYDGWARNLAWDAGWLAATSPSHELAITEVDAIKFVTTNLQEIFGLKDEDESSRSRFVLWSASPLDMHSRPVFAHTNEEGIQYL